MINLDLKLKKEMNKKMKMIVKKKSKVTKALFAATFLITIIALITTVNAYDSNRILFIAKGDDLDLDGTTNFITGRIKFGEDDELPSAKAVFHQKIYDDSGKEVYSMKGILKEGLLQTKYYNFFCPIFEVWFINVYRLWVRECLRLLIPITL